MKNSKPNKIIITGAQFDRLKPLLDAHVERFTTASAEMRAKEKELNAEIQSNVDAVWAGIHKEVGIGKGDGYQFDLEHADAGLLVVAAVAGAQQIAQSQKAVSNKRKTA